ncbi:MAG: 1,4-alpha-glucan branching protein GlgB [Oscillospiraceae bacterium]|nr:1,4-alpha-glucan branching protein GlgB [Oscillospiraceae bacterium]
MNLNDFYTGRSFTDYNYLGAKISASGTVFRTYAPNAVKVSVIGEFNDWQDTPMTKIENGQFYECYISNAVEGMMYKYRIYHTETDFVDHCDPYGYGMELRPHNASIIRDLSKFKFDDKKWLENRTDCHGMPLNIYEVHLGSWKNNPENPNGWYTYSEIADLLIPYVKENGYNYIEFMPLSEHPCDESWGYQNTGFFSPTSRYGTALELMELVNKCHKNNIGVIMDFVPVHFAVDGYGLANYDGTPIYEYPNNDITHSEWGSLNFIHSRGEVRSFLQSAANFWLDVFHFDGLRMDAISRIIYWQGDSDRGVNDIAVQFLREMNRGLKELHPTAILCAEDSTNYLMITKPYSEGGLAFDYKWDMGWMNDTLDYFRQYPWIRPQEYHKLTFSMMYFYNEHFILPLSHDEVVHGKATIAQKMNGDYDNKFPQARAMYMYMYAHPGKKLNFMGNEFAQLREWDEKREQDWDILKYPTHDSFHKFIKDLNKLYLKEKALWKWDDDPRGFEWIDCHQEEKCIYVMKRKCPEQKIVAVFNFNGMEQKSFEINSGKNIKYKFLIASDMQKYGGKNEYKRKIFNSDKNGIIKLNLAPFSAVYFEEVSSKKTR